MIRRFRCKPAPIVGAPVPMATLYRFADFELNCRTRELLRRDTPVAMPARCFECLQYLIEQRKHAVSRDELAEAVFGRSNVSDAQIGQVVLRARRAVGDDGQNQGLIRTVPRYGYRWVGETVETDSPPGAARTVPRTPAIVSRLPRPGSWRRRGLAAALLCAATAAWGLVVEHESGVADGDPESVLLRAKEDFIVGRHERGLASLDHLLEARGDRGDVRFRARALLQRARFEMRLGRHADAEQDFSAALGLVDAGVEPSLAGRARNGRGLARMALGKFDASQEDLQQARKALVRSGDLRSVGWVDANLGLLQRRRAGPDGGDAADSIDLSNTFVGEDDPGMGDPNGGSAERRAAIHFELASLHRQLLEWPQAQAHATRAWALRTEIGDAAGRREVALGMAETLIGNGRLHDAQVLLDTLGGTRATAADDPRVGMLQIELLRQRGEVDAALELSDRTWATSVSHVAPALLRQLQRQRLQLGLEADAPVAGKVVAPSFADDAMDAWLIRALSAQSRRLGPEAGLAYRQAMERAVDGGTPAQVVAVAQAYLPWLVQRRAFEDAAAVAERIAPFAGQDYGAALLQWQLAQAVGDSAQSHVSAAHVRRLAGDRPLPGQP